MGIPMGNPHGDSHTHGSPEKLCYRRGTARRDVSVNICQLLHNSLGTTCTTSWEQIEVMELKGYSRPTVINLCIQPRFARAIHRQLVWQYFPSPKCRNYSLHRHHADSTVSHHDANCQPRIQNLKALTLAVQNISTKAGHVVEMTNPHQTCMIQFIEFINSVDYRRRLDLSRYCSHMSHD